MRSDRGIRVSGTRPSSAPLVVEAKLRRPAVRAEVIARPALLERLDDAIERPSTVVVAPAGYGKTTALTTWAAGRDDTAWVTVDVRDVEPSRLIAHVLSALERTGADVGESWPALLSGADPTAVVVPLLTNALATANDRTRVLVLDDVHIIEGASSTEALRALVETAPDGLRVVLASRRALPWGLARRRAAGEVTELGPDDLRLTDEEVALLVNDRLGLGLSADDTRGLAAVTEGWAAAVSLAVLGGPGGWRALVRDGETPFDVAEFLVQEVLDDADESMRTFLRRTSILAALTPGLCRAVLDDPDAGRLLAAARRSNLLMTPIDAGGVAVRYHQLLAELLRSELQHREPALVPELHRRAAAWLADAGELEDATEHAILSGDAVTAAGLLGEQWVGMLQARRFEAVTTILDRLPGPAGAYQPFVDALRTLVVALSVGVGSAERRRYREHAERDGDLQWTRVVKQLQSSYLCGDFGLARRACDARRGTDDHDDPRIRYGGVIQRAMLSWLTDDPRLQELRTDHGPPPESGLTVRVWYSALAATAASRAGAHAEAVALAREAVHETERHGAGGTSSFTLVYAAGAAVLLECGLLDEADQLLDRADRVTRRTPDSVDHLLTLVLQARTAVARGHRPRARALVAAARPIVADCADVGVLAVWLEQVESALARRGPAMAIGSSLSVAESRVLRLLPTDLSLAEIASELFITRNTVRTHVRVIYRRLGVSSREAAVVAARERGLITGPRRPTQARPHRDASAPLTGTPVDTGTSSVGGTALPASRFVTARSSGPGTTSAPLRGPMLGGGDGGS